MNLRMSGPCLLCKRHISYARLSKKHKTEGDIWLDKLYRGWKTPIEFSRNGHWIAVNGRTCHDVTRYSCSSCATTLRKVWQDVRNNGRSERPRRQDQIKSLRRLSYEDYLKTSHWVLVKRAVRQRDGRQCLNCGRPGRTQIHHVSYKHLGDELKHLSDLVSLCALCHRDGHRIPVSREDLVGFVDATK